jgi:SIR2-like domain
VHGPITKVTLPTLVPDELAQAVASRQAILFAGAGLSMSVGLPSWQEFAHRMAQELGVRPDLLNCRGIGYHTLAEYYRLKQGSIGPLRSWMDRTWTVSREKVRQSKLHELIMALDFSLIYTTNYDRNIEEAFVVYDKEFVKVANARDIAKTREGIPQIVKFHGDFDDDSSLVITETDYFNRLSFDSPLDIKFRSDALAKTVLFIGYSMSDMNIRLLLHNLWRTWQTSGYERDRPKSFVFMAEADPVQSAVLEQWGITALSAEEDDPQEALTHFLTALGARVGELNAAAA